jgi:para-aminobenzoate synthetase/4-amino-4-deoxychorismate lyase
LLDLPAGPVVLGLAPRPVPAEQARLSGFKTSRREVYDQAIREAEAQGRFDLLFFNERDELTEGARSNVLVRMGGRWFTPPLSSGLLPGVMRATLLADPGFGLGERVIRRSDLPDIEAWRVCNALRGILPATLSA